ncbi:MAG: prepilin-type N-terminal cleavage/methylation domain-containing protein [Chloroflexi bacterium]|nr:prepilin-type N-terminal cleavage/methylation domain-containing protein [Chloroflexota bacterium]MCH8235074.1 prepilin-type N-terminal cleavage/methylation domain-containing protein [Chloroflexota bacterium]
MLGKRSTAARGQRGFTLVELLVVIGILAALAAVVVPNVGRFAGSGDQAANDTEAATAQAAMDLYMADTASLTVAANAIETDNFAASDPILSPGYLRQNPTRCAYTWDASGLVTQGTCP